MRSVLSVFGGLFVILFALLACGRKSGTSTSTGTSTTSIAASAGDRDFVVTDIKVGSEGILAALQPEVKKAEAQGMKPFVEFWAVWCEPCKAIEKSLDDPQMKAAFRGTYVIRIEVDSLTDPALKGTGFSVDVIPVFYELGSDAKPTGRSIDGGAWGDNVPKNMAPPLGAFFHGH